MARHSRVGAALLWLGTVPLAIFLLLPSSIIIPMALTKGQIIQFPPDGISLHPFTDYQSDAQWMHATLLSFQVAVRLSSSAV
jgi:ABC-type spermidine/putrescine transport system permease subunit II